MRTNPGKEENLLEKLRPKSELIEEIESRLSKAEKLGINIGSTEGAILQTIASLPYVEKVVEIGTQYGCSTTWLAMGLGSRGKIITLEKDPMCINQAKKTFHTQAFQELGCQVELLAGDATESLKLIENQGPFDLVFIDANKSGYLNYYMWAKEFIRPGGFLIADNIYLFGTMFESEPPAKTPKKMWSVMKSFLHEVFNDDQFTSSLIPTGEGLLIAVKK